MTQWGDGPVGSVCPNGDGAHPDVHREHLSYTHRWAEPKADHSSKPVALPTRHPYSFIALSFWMDTNVSEKHTTSIFRAEDECETWGSHGSEDVDVGLRIETPCGLVGRYQRLGGTYCLHPQGSYLPTNPWGVTTQKTNISILILSSNECLVVSALELPPPKFVEV
jgi:hypothetical protein